MDSTVSPKVVAGALGGATTTIFVWILSVWVAVPAEVASAITVIVSTILAWVISDKLRTAGAAAAEAPASTPVAALPEVAALKKTP